jgi:hypothetical protein
MQIKQLDTIPAEVQDTPWGPAQQAFEYGEGLIFVHTLGHGGFWLSPTRWNALKELWPAFRPFNDRTYWLEEDIDCCLAPLAFPDLFTDQDVFNAIVTVRNAEAPGSGARGWRQVAAWLNGAAGQLLRIRADDFARSVKDQWERGGLSGGPDDPGWWVHLYRGGEHQCLCFRQYPEKQFYTEAELAGLTVPGVTAPRYKSAPRGFDYRPAPDEGDYSGAFDGFQVTSDADPGL